MPVYLVEGGNSPVQIGFIGNLNVVNGRPSSSEGHVSLHQADSAFIPDSPHFFDSQTVVLKDATVRGVNLPGWTVIAHGMTIFRGKIYCGCLIFSQGFTLRNVRPA